MVSSKLGDIITCISGEEDIDLKKKHRLRICLIVLAVLAAVAIAFILPAVNNVKDALYQSETVERGSISTYYSFSGSLELRRQETLAAQTDCEVRDVYVAEGDHVAKDDRLMRLSDGRTLRAGIDGEVVSVDVEEDDLVTMGQELVGIADFDSMRIEFDVDEFDVEAVSVGMDAQVTIDALDYTFTSPVTHISKTAQLSGDISYYTAHIEPEAGVLPEAALPGMRVDVKTLGASADDVLLLSMEALSFDEYNKPYVLVDVDGQKQRQYVETGINDGVYVEITSGLDEGDVIYYLTPLSDFEEMMQMGRSRSGADD